MAVLLETVSDSFVDSYLQMLPHSNLNAPALQPSNCCSMQHCTFGMLVLSCSFNKLFVEPARRVTTLSKKPLACYGTAFCMTHRHCIHFRLFLNVCATTHVSNKPWPPRHMSERIHSFTLIHTDRFETSARGNGIALLCFSSGCSRSC